MNKNMLVVGVVVVAVVAIGFQQMKIARLEKALAEKKAVERVVVKTAAPAPAVAPAPRRVAATKPHAEADTLPVEELTAPAPAVAMTAPAPAAPVAKAGKAKPEMGDFMKNIGSMMTNPAMKEMIKQQAKLGLDMQYSRLFKFLDRSPEQTEALKTILMDRQMALMEFGMAFLNGNAAPEERAKQGRDLKAVKDSYDKKIEELLGADDYDAFKQYEETQAERTQVELFKSSIASSGEPLTEQQEFDLVKAMHTARTNSPALSAMMKQDEAPDPAMFSESGITNLLAQMEKMQRQYAAVASTILSPAQNKQFESFLEQQKAMNEMGIKFAAQMFGGQSNAAPASGETP